MAEMMMEGKVDAKSKNLGIDAKSNPTNIDNVKSSPNREQRKV